MIWHSEDINAVKAELGVNCETGLSAAEIAGKIQKYGENKVSADNNKSVFLKLKKRFTSASAIILLIFSAVLLVIGIIDAENTKWYLPIFIPIMLLINGIFSALAELKSEKGLISLKQEVTLSAKVKRDGEISVVDINTIVPGDIVILEEGDFIPADGRLLESTALICDESAVTGDTDPSEKDCNFIPDDICLLNDRKNMVFYGCSVTFGSGVMLVTETGMETEFARKEVIAEQTIGHKNPLGEKLTEISKLLSYGMLSVSVIIFILSVIYGSGYFSSLVFNSLLLAAAFSVTSLPHSLPGTVIFALGFGVRKMFDKRVVIKNTDAALGIGYTSVIISDKTGTLTKNKMKTVELYDGTSLISLKNEAPDQNFLTLISTAALCCDSKVLIGAGGRKRYIGDPTEAAIVEACLDYCNLSKDDIENMSPRMEVVPFDSERKLMSTINIINNRPFAIVKGSADILIDCCTGGNISGTKAALEEMAKKGLRVIAVAIKPLDEIPSNPTADEIECDLSILGLFGIDDVITDETKEMIKSCDKAGIKTVMITGDYITSAITTAEKIGIMKADSLAITGEELSEMDDDEFMSKIRNISVYSRITAEDKLRIIETFKRLGETVTVTGDSALDAIVLREADIGCAMGASGTDISKGSADLVLNEDSYISIGNSIKHSRGILKNIKRAVSLELSLILAEALIMILGFFIFGVAVISARGLIFINLITLFFPLISLLAESAGDEVMSETPSNPKRSILKDGTGISIAWQGAVLALLTLIAYGVGISIGKGEAMGLAFATLGLCTTALAFNLRSEITLLKTGILTNKYMLISVGASLLSVLLIICTPLAPFFSIALTGQNTGLLILFAVIPFFLAEGIKLTQYLIKRYK